jgi:hypothetical protein
MVPETATVSYADIKTEVLTTTDQDQAEIAQIDTVSRLPWQLWPANPASDFGSPEDILFENSVAIMSLGCPYDRVNLIATFSGLVQGLDPSDPRLPILGSLSPARLHR